jgi:hypothetical protein
MSEWYADEKPSGKPFVPETGPAEYEDPLAMTEMREWPFLQQSHSLGPLSLLEARFCALLAAP